MKLNLNISSIKIGFEVSEKTINTIFKVQPVIFLFICVIIVINK